MIRKWEKKENEKKVKKNDILNNLTFNLKIENDKSPLKGRILNKTASNLGLGDAVNPPAHKINMCII